MSDSKQYEVNFFKPLSDHAKANKKLIIVLATIWAVAVFGFQFLLIGLEEPTPEPAYETFTKVYPAVVEDTNATPAMKADFARSLLNVLGKNIAVKDNHKEVLKNSLSWMVADMLPDSVKPEMKKTPDAATFKLAAETIGLKYSGFEKIMTDLLPFSIVKVESNTFPKECKEQLPGIMELYLIHNRSVLTDFTFLGFPFHYWYSAQFLLILFVLLCIYYAVAIEKANKRHNFVEET